jgi:hypothetical protein
LNDFIKLHKSLDHYKRNQHSEQQRELFLQKYGDLIDGYRIETLARSEITSHLLMILLEQSTVLTVVMYLHQVPVLAIHGVCYITVLRLGN